MSDSQFGVLRPILHVLFDHELEQVLDRLNDAQRDGVFESSQFVYPASDVVLALAAVATAMEGCGMAVLKQDRKE